MKFITDRLPENNNKRWWIVILYNLILSALLSILSIYVISEYGLALFFVLPFISGFFPVWLYTSKNKKMRGSEAIGLGSASLFFHLLFLMLFAMEGLICIIMALPILLLLTIAGAGIANEIRKHQRINLRNSNKPLLGIIGLFPVLLITDKYNEPDLTRVTTSIVIDATPEKVWENVVEFPQLLEPDEMIFKAGIAYPINAKINGKGVGSIRYCNFTTGSFVEPITTWNEPELLAFSVKEQPAPMKELSFWDIDAPHLHDYFVSKKGQFKLTALPNGKTKLEGTTWYYHDIKPSFYWSFWSEYIVHKIHMRVLKHIKTNAERK